ncbi:Mov34/MPN/PAD-1 family protein [Silvibacterium acidisoli]|uniref:Mov34/MPN/PAD-1 family protein n=1 Tax=Acidobacteriaceae bacterium ZG23-2 TaxID=2883246 RepID=UPI00406C3EE5
MTATPRFQVDNEVTRCIRQHARTHMTTEVCGVLIGELRGGVVEIQASIEASNAAQAGTHVTFTQDAWETIYKVKDESYPNERIVGWYHSHPGFGVFLSEHDTFIHRNFFSSPDQVAWVYDPHTDEEGCFGWVDGEIHRIPFFSVVDNAGDGVERTPKETPAAQVKANEEPPPAPQQPLRREAGSAWMRWAGMAMIYLSLVALGFAVSYFLFPRILLVTFDPVTKEPLIITRDGERIELRRPDGSGAYTLPQPVQKPDSPSGGQK